MAKALAFLFHPAFYPIPVYLLFLYTLPLAMPGFQNEFAWIVTGALVVLPISVVMVLWGLGLINDPYLKTIRERRIPIISSVFFYLMAYRFFSQIFILESLGQFYLGLSIGLGLALIFQEIKPSLHLLAAGAFFAAIVIFKLPGGYTSLMIGLAWILCSGVLGMSRIQIKAHSPREVFLGFSLGFFPVLLTYFLI